MALLLLVSLPFFAATLWVAPSVFEPGAEPMQWIAAAVMSVVWAGFFLFTARAVSRATRWPTGLDLDHAAGELRIREAELFGRGSREAIVPLARLAGLSVRRTAKAPSDHDPLRPQKPGPGIALDFRLHREGASGSDAFDLRTLAFGVEHLDRPDEVADLALRLGAASGLRFFRIVRNDARDVEVLLQRGAEVGFAAVPAGLGPADYARDAVAPAARALAATETVPPFDPRAFPSGHRVTAWRPGLEARFHKPLTMGAILGLPFTLLLFAGPAVFFFIQSVAAPGSPLAPRLALSAFVGVFGLVFGFIALVVVSSALPRRVAVDWTERMIEIRKPTGRQRIPFATVQALEMKAIHRVLKGKNSTRHVYSCEVALHVKDPDTGALSCTPLVATESLTDDPDTPYRATLPLATELAQALGVPRRVSDYA
jgi:hypothetical protein